MSNFKIQTFMFYLHLLWYRYWTQRNKHRYRYSLLRNEDLQEPYETPDPDEDLVLLAPESDDELTEEDSDDDEESEEEEEKELPVVTGRKRNLRQQTNLPDVTKVKRGTLFMVFRI